MCTSAMLICKHLFRETVLEPDPRKFGAIQYMCLPYIGFMLNVFVVVFKHENVYAKFFCSK